MIRATRLGFLAFTLLAISSAAWAQRGFSHVRLYSAPARVSAARAMAVHTMAVRPIVVRLPVSPAVRQIVTVRSATETSVQGTGPDSLFNSSNADQFGGSQITLGELLNPVPGLGFDFSNLAAINRDLAVRAIIDPITQQELALTERLLQEAPAAPISFPFFGSESQPVVMMEQPPPQVIVVQQPQPIQQPTPEASSPVASSSPPPEQPPLPDIGEFVLVLRDGTRIKAVAFTQQKDRIVYITKDGLRQSFAASDLDTAATQRLNEQRGTPLQLPSLEDTR